VDGGTSLRNSDDDTAARCHDPVQVSSSYGKLPLSFEINRGQTDSRVKFLARGQGYGLFLTSREAVLSLRAAQPGTRPGQGPQARPWQGSEGG